MEDVVYFELNNWFPVRDYPNAEPFTTWCGDDMHLYFNNENFVRENELCVVQSLIDMSVNWCITAKRSWVEQNCPKLLSDESTSTMFKVTGPKGTTEKEESKPYSSFLRFPEEGETMVYGQFGTEFLEYLPENIGITYSDIYEDYSDDYEDD